jgi:hypothetical protein
MGLRLVTSSQKDNTINWVSEQDLDQGEVGQISVQHCSRPLGSLLNWMTWEFKWCSAICDDSISHPLGKGDMVRVAWSEVGPGLRNTDNWLLLVCEFLH